MMASLSDEAQRKLGELEFRRLLVAVDGSGNSELALSAAITAARRSNAALTLICVAPDVVADAARFPSAAQIVPTDQDQVDRHAEDVLSQAVDLIPDDIPVTKIVRRGRAGQQIVAAADESTYDAILMGARGVGRIGALLGSVSQYVTHHAKIAVFVAHAPREE
jgi:nucleotide-binding universal stress UspA family protein